MIDASRLGRWWAAVEILVIAAVLLILVRLAIRRTPLPEIRSRIAARTPRGATRARLPASEIGRLVSAVGRRLPGIGTCLTHALVTEALLRREHHAAQLVVGIKRGHGSRPSAHAWVTSDDVVVVGAAADLGRFTPLAVGRDSSTLRSFAANNPRSDDRIANIS